MTTVKDSDITLSLLDKNDLIYLPNLETTLTVQRHQRVQYALKNSYNGQIGQIMTFQFHGRHFASFPNSYLSFDFTPLVNDARFNFQQNPNFGGTCINLFNEVRVLTSNGVELARTQKHNLLMYHLNKQKAGYWVNLGLQNELGGSNTLFPIGATYEFVVPLRMISPIFQSSQLCPPCILDGLQIEISLENPSVAYTSTDETSRYTITNPRIIMDSYILNDQTTIIIERQSPLVYEYTSWMHTESTVPLSDVRRSVNMRMPYPLSNVVEAITFTRIPTNTTDATADSFATLKPNIIVDTNNVDQYQYQWGDIQYPQQPLIGAEQQYAQMLYVNNKLSLNNLDSFGVAFNTILRVTDEAPPYYSMVSYNAQLRRSSMNDNSGVKVSYDSELLFLARFASNIEAEWTSRIIDFYCQYVGRVMFVDGVITVSK